MFEIKGAPCVHGFNAGCTILKAVHPACAPFSQILGVYLGLCAFNLTSGCTLFLPSAPGGCTNLNLNFEHCTGLPPMFNSLVDMIFFNIKDFLEHVKSTEIGWGLATECHRARALGPGCTWAPCGRLGAPRKCAGVVSQK